MKPIAWYDPSNGMVSTDQDSPLFTPLGQVWSLYPEREWVGLTDDEIDQGLLRTNYAMQTAGVWRDGVEWAIKQLKERNA